MKARFALIALLAIIVMALGACAAPTPQVVEKVVTQVVTQEKVVEKVSTQIVEKEKIVEKQVTVAPAATPVPAKKIVSWFQYDQGNVDPKADEKVGQSVPARRRAPLQQGVRLASMSGRTSTLPGRNSEASSSRPCRRRVKCPISLRWVAAMSPLSTKTARCRI